MYFLLPGILSQTLIEVFLVDGNIGIAIAAFLSEKAEREVQTATPTVSISYRELVNSELQKIGTAIELGILSPVTGKVNTANNAPFVPEFGGRGFEVVERELQSLISTVGVPFDFDTSAIDPRITGEAVELIGVEPGTIPIPLSNTIREANDLSLIESVDIQVHGIINTASFNGSEVVERELQSLVSTVGVPFDFDTSAIDPRITGEAVELIGVESGTIPIPLSNTIREANDLSLIKPVDIQVQRVTATSEISIIEIATSQARVTLTTSEIISISIAERELQRTINIFELILEEYATDFLPGSPGYVAGIPGSAVEIIGLESGTLPLPLPAGNLSQGEDIGFVEAASFEPNITDQASEILFAEACIKVNTAIVLSFTTSFNGFEVVERELQSLISTVGVPFDFDTSTIDPHIPGEAVELIGVEPGTIPIPLSNTIREANYLSLIEPVDIQVHGIINTASFNGLEVVERELQSPVSIVGVPFDFDTSAIDPRIPGEAVELIGVESGTIPIPLTNTITFGIGYIGTVEPTKSENHSVISTSEFFTIEPCAELTQVRNAVRILSIEPATVKVSTIINTLGLSTMEVGREIHQIPATAEILLIDYVAESAITKP